MAKQVLVPPLGTTVDTVTLVSWYKAEGEAVKKGEPLFVIETDKANLDVESPATGILRGVNAVAGDEMKALTVIGYIAEADETVAAPTTTKSTVEDVPAQIVTQPELKTILAPGGNRVFISPRARRLAEDNHILISQLQASGPEGAIIERDVTRFLQSQRAPNIPATGIPAIETSSQLQQLLEPQSAAATLVQSATETTQFTLSAEVDITELVIWRGRLLETAIKPSLSSFILFAAGRTLALLPLLSPGSLGGSSNHAPEVDIGLAVAEGKRFQFPVIHKVDHKGLAKLAAEERDLLEQAAAGKLPAQSPGVCALRLCNLGEFGIDTFTPWISASECPVLSVGRNRRLNEAHDGKTNTRQVLWLSLTADSRLTDGLQAALFVQGLVRYLENPTLLIGI
jgi:pyruvate dehydrogenase E2 component (dihydrolipoamide acetyltransferase)